MCILFILLLYLILPSLTWCKGTPALNNELCVGWVIPAVSQDEA